MANICHYHHPLLELTLVKSSKGLRRIYFGHQLTPTSLPSDTEFLAITEQLDEYLAGQRSIFNLVLDIQGTEFQQQVWRELINIPYGHSASYQDIAINIGNPKATRAVGMANNKNPLPIIIPCHRVIGKNGQLTGYAGGLSIKKQLLDLEGCHYESKE